MLYDLASLLGGGFLLYLGAEWFVGGASGLAARLGIAPLLIGLTVVAYGTSAPEVIVGLQAAATGHGDLALGNVTGSNIANLGLILGVVALIRPPSVTGGLSRREIPVMVGSAFLVPLALLDGELGRLDGLLLLLLAALYTTWMIRSSRSAADRAEAQSAASAVSEAADQAGAPATKSKTLLVVFSLAGLAGLVLGGRFFVEGASALALSFGMSERLVGLTIVAVGTSLPELATSLLAALRGHADIAVGNVVGSNVFNVFLCLGGAGLVAPLPGEVSALWFDLSALVLLTLFGAWTMRTERTISRTEGAFLLSCYLAFLAVLIVA